MKKKTEQKSEVNSLEAEKDSKMISSMIHDIRGLQVISTFHQKIIIITFKDGDFFEKNDKNNK